MKNRSPFRKLTVALTVIVVLELSGIAAAAQADDDMELVHTDQDKSWYVNTRSRVSPTPGTITFWNKIVPSKGSPYFTQMGAVLGRAGKDPDRLEYVQILQELECGTNNTKILSVIFYDRQGRIIYNSTSPSTTGDVFGFQQVANSVRNTVCTASSPSAPGKQGPATEVQAPSVEKITTDQVDRLKAEDLR